MNMSNPFLDFQPKCEFHQLAWSLPARGEMGALSSQGCWRTVVGPNPTGSVGRWGPCHLKPWESPGPLESLGFLAEAASLGKVVCAGGGHLAIPQPRQRA